LKLYLFYAILGHSRSS